MKQIICNYAPIRFLPYREIDEFVNIGVVIHCPQTDYFNYRLVSLKRTRRVAGFFPELDLKVFKDSLKGLGRELLRVQGTHQLFPTNNDIDPQIAKEQIERFKEVVRPREGMLCFGDIGTLASNSTDAALNDLFGRFVERQFAQKREYQEIVMRNKLALFLRDWKLDKRYEINKKVGDDDFHVSMPFVHFTNNVVAKVIKPLDLNKSESSDIFQHGGTWVKNIERLKKRNQMPASVVFTIQLPTSGKRLNAANEICDEFRALGVEPIKFNDTLGIRKAVEV